MERQGAREESTPPWSGCYDGLFSTANGGFHGRHRGIFWFGMVLGGRIKGIRCTARLDTLWQIQGR